MDRKELNERFLKIFFVDDVQLVDVNSDWEEIFESERVVFVL